MRDREQLLAPIHRSQLLSVPHFDPLRPSFRSSGGAAKGMPLKTRTLGWPELTTPASIPVSIRTCSGIAEAAAVKAISDAAAMKHLMRVIISLKLAGLYSIGCAHLFQRCALLFSPSPGSGIAYSDSRTFGASIGYRKKPTGSRTTSVTGRSRA
jgi:hypothetical protein